MDFNKVIIAGRLTKDPEVRTTTSGQTVATLSVATGSVFKNAAGEKQEKTEFHSVVVWGKTAENCGQYLVKGQELLVEGRLETRSWDAPNGEKKFRTEIIAENVQFGAKPRQAGASGYDRPAPAKGPSAPAGEPTVEEEEIKIEDIPF